MIASTGNYSTYGLYWNEALSTPQTVYPFILNLFHQSWTDYNTNKNGIYISTLLNTNNWDGFINNRYADYAIGGPTLEMWVESYNEKEYKPLYTSTNLTGYYVGDVESPTTYVYNLSSDIGYSDTLYFPFQSNIMDDGTQWGGYWLASPSAYHAYSLMHVSCDGIVNSSGHNSGNYNSNVLGIRPLVCLNSGITATKDEEGIWRF